MTVKELLLQIKKEGDKNPDVLNYSVTTEGWCCGTDHVEIDHKAKEVNVS